jgi:hypothetical protein
MLSRLAISVVAGSLALAFGSGCGDGPASSGTGPASVAPVAAPFYAEAVVQPEGAQRDNAEAILGKILDSSDGPAALRRLLDQALQKEAPGATYRKDVAPWLGDRIGVAVGSIGGHEAVSVIVATTDTGKALAAAHKGRKGPITKRSYRGVAYEVAADDDATAIVGEFLVGGNEAGIKQAIDASKGDALAESDRYKAAVADAPAERLGFMYVDPKRVIDSVTSAGGVDPQTRGLLQNALGGAEGQPILAVVRAEADAVVVEATTTFKGPLAAFSTQPTALMDELPADTWIALGQSDLGQALGGLVDNAGLLGIPGVTSATARFFVKQRFGIDIDKDLLSWMGDAAVFVRGTLPEDIEGGLVIEATDPAAAKAGVTKLAFLAQALGRKEGVRVTGKDGNLRLRGGGLAKPVYLVAEGDRVFVAYGETAFFEAARDQGHRLPFSDSYKAAVASLHGPKPALFVDLRSVWDLIDVTEQGDPDWVKARRYLDAIASFAMAAEKDGDRTRSVAAVAVP